MLSNQRHFDLVQSEGEGLAAVGGIETIGD